MYYRFSEDEISSVATKLGVLSKGIKDVDNSVEGCVWPFFSEVLPVQVINQDFEAEIVKLPICMRVPILQLYFKQVWSMQDSRMQTIRKFEMACLLELVKIVLRMYDRHVLLKDSDYERAKIGYKRFASFAGFSGKDAFDRAEMANRIMALADNMKKSNENSLFAMTYFEIYTDLTHKFKGFADAMDNVKHYLVFEVMSLLALYAHDMLVLSKESASNCQEISYYWQWDKMRLWRRASVFCAKVPVPSEMGTFIKHYSFM